MRNYAPINPEEYKDFEDFIVIQPYSKSQNFKKIVRKLDTKLLEIAKDNFEKLFEIKELENIDDLLKYCNKTKKYLSKVLPKEYRLYVKDL